MKTWWENDSISLPSSSDLNRLCCFASLSGWYILRWQWTSCKNMNVFFFLISSWNDIWSHTNSSYVHHSRHRWSVVMVASISEPAFADTSFHSVCDTQKRWHLAGTRKELRTVRSDSVLFHPATPHWAEAQKNATDMHVLLKNLLKNRLIVFGFPLSLVSGGSARIQQWWRWVWPEGWEEVSGRHGGSGQHHEQRQESKGQALSTGMLETLSVFNVTCFVLLKMGF